MTAEAGLKNELSRRASREGFATTMWTVVLAAGRSSASTEALSALDSLCRSYWYPLYAYVRSKGNGPHDAEDLVQGFFSQLVRLNSLAGLSREKGRFRAFLLAGMRNYMSDEWRRASAFKRDARRTVSWDAMEAESRYSLEPADRLTPERLYDRRWALSLLGDAVRRLQDEYERSGRGDLFRALQPTLSGEKGESPYAEIAARTGLSEGALRVAAHRFRRRYRQLLREAIADTVAEPADVDAELADLRCALAGGT